MLTTIKRFAALCLLLVGVCASAQPTLPLSACTPLAQPQAVALTMGVHAVLVCTTTTTTKRSGSGFVRGAKGLNCGQLG